VVEELSRQQKPVEYHLIESDYGHDSFLVEPEKFIPILDSFLRKI
jgi:homoserine O-acetyltransferase